MKKLIDSGFVREDQHPDWVAIIVLVPKRIKRSDFASTTEI